MYRKGEKMILLDLKDSRPIYEQVVDKFRQLMLNGVLKSEDKMPSVRTLAMELSIKTVSARESAAAQGIKAKKSLLMR